jgi:hypothetical protein
MQCSNHLKQIALASHNFYDTQNRYPSNSLDALWGVRNPNNIPVPSPDPTGAALGAFYRSYYPCRIRQAGLIPLFFPYMEQFVILDDIIAEGQRIARERTQNDTGGHFSPAAGAKCRVKISSFLCPSDPTGSEWTDAYVMWTNYRVSFGDLPGPGVIGGNSEYQALSPGWYMPFSRAWTDAPSRSPRTMADITDGLSNTVLFSEGLITPNSAAGRTTNGVRSGSIMVQANIREGNSSTNNKLTTGILAPQALLNLKATLSTQPIKPFADINGHQTAKAAEAQTNSAGLGRAAMASPLTDAAFFTFLPPNSPSIHQDSVRICPTASSYHTSGVNAALMDGSVHFITDSISTQNFDLATEGSDPIMLSGNASWTYTTAQPAKCIALNSNGSVAAGEEFSYGIWADLGCINDGKAVAVP